MSKKFNIVQIGLGPMGRIIADLLLKRKNINFVSAIDIDPGLIGKKLNELLESKYKNDILVESDLVQAFKSNPVDLVIIATSSSLASVAPLIKESINLGAHVISICEELSYPFQNSPKLSKELDSLAKENNVSVLGTGINPGYLMDLLPILITAPCQSVKSIKVTRMMNSSKRRVPFQKKIGTGLTVEEFHEKISNKEITGHIGLTQSIQMIIAALGLDYDEIFEYPPKEVVAEKDFTTSYGETVLKGYVRGLQSTAIAKKGEVEIIVLDFIAFSGDHEEYDSILIEGIPDIKQKIIGGVHGDLGTSAIVVNLIPTVINAKAGLLTMKDIPVPCNTENIWKKKNNNN
ncbi:MAG: dihydrodipicolinate reductase [Promethearchaeota archaeon]